MTNTVLVTGGSGFIGTHLLQALAADDTVKRVIVLDVASPRFQDAKVDYNCCDITKPIQLTVPAACDTCYHLAALCKEPGYDWDSYFEVNHAGTSHLLEFLSAAGINNLVFTSTMMVYRAGEMRRSECSLTAPDTAYGISKLLAESEIEQWVTRAPGRRAHILRPGVVFGQWENGNFTRLHRALKRGWFAYVGRPDTVKGCVYVKDVVRAMLFLSKLTNQIDVFNLVIPSPLTIAEICRSMQSVLGLRVRRIPVVPYRLALALGYLGEVLSAVGINNPLHHRRIEKLWHSTNISADSVMSAGFEYAYDLLSGLADWRRSCAPQDLY